MNTINFVIIYASIAAAVAAHVFYFGVLHAPRVSVFTLSDQGILALSSLAIGALWLLFVPTTVVLVFMRAIRVVRSRSGGWAAHRPHAARAGS